MPCRLQLCRDGECRRAAKNRGGSIPFSILAVPVLYAGPALDCEPLGRRATHFGVVLGGRHCLADLNVLLDFAPRLGLTYHSAVIQIASTACEAQICEPAVRPGSNELFQACRRYSKHTLSES